MYCKKCGTEIGDGSQFCWKCGNKIDQNELIVEVEEKNEQKNVQKNEQVEKNEPIVKVEKIEQVEKNIPIPEKTSCWNCKEEIDMRFDKCPMCGVCVRIIILKNPGIAAVLSFFFPGLGHVYNGKVAIGAMITIVEISIVAIIILLTRSSDVIYGLVLLVVGIILWIYSMYNSYDIAEDINYKQYR